MFTEKKKSVEDYIPQLYDEQATIREYLALQDNVEVCDALALAVLDEAMDLFTMREKWGTPIGKELILAWWRWHCSLPYVQSRSVYQALALNNMYAPAWSSY